MIFVQARRSIHSIINPVAKLNARKSSIIILLSHVPECPMIKSCSLLTSSQDPVNAMQYNTIQWKKQFLSQLPTEQHGMERNEQNKKNN